MASTNIEESSEIIEDDDDTKEKSVFVDINSLKPKEKLYLKSIDHFFKNADQQENINKMITIIDGTSRISLRMLDWFITRYANKNKISYTLTADLNNDDQFRSDFNVHISYKAQLKSYKKKYFDPFRRRTKILYKYNKVEDKSLETTIGQLNFFKWAFSNEIIKYVEEHYDIILKEMGKTNKEDKKKKLDKKTESDKSSIASSDKTEKSSGKNKSIKYIKEEIKEEKTNTPFQIILNFD